MGLLSWILKPHRMTDDENRHQIEKLDAKRRHLRGKMSRLTGEIQRSWTAYRTWRGEEAGKRRLRTRIKHLEAERKAHVKEMLKLQSEMKKLGVEAAAGAVDIS